MALTRWVDSFFGDVEGDAETAESRLRVKVSTQWDERFPNQNRVTVGGKIDLPRLANRVDLVFRGDDPDELIRGDQNDPSQSQVGIQVNLDERKAETSHRPHRGTVKLGPKPGFKYRYHTMFNENTALRFSQRAQYDLDDGAYATTKLDVDYVLSDTSSLRTQNRILLGRDAEGAEWSTNFGRVRQWTDADGFERASFLYFEVQGQTKPHSYVNNYQLGLRFRAKPCANFYSSNSNPPLTIERRALCAKRECVGDRGSCRVFVIRLDLPVVRHSRGLFLRSYKFSSANAASRDLTIPLMCMILREDRV